MSNFVFNNAKGKVAYYAGLPDALDGLIAVPLETTGLEADTTMINRTSLLGLLTASTEQTTLGRMPLTGVTVEVIGNSIVVNVDDFVYTAGSGSPVAAFIVCYVPESGVSTDDEIIPLTKHDFSLIPTGTDIPVQISAGGLFVASSNGL